NARCWQQLTRSCSRTRGALFARTCDLPAAALLGERLDSRGGEWFGQLAGRLPVLDGLRAHAQLLSRRAQADLGPRCAPLLALPSCPSAIARVISKSQVKER